MSHVVTVEAEVNDLEAVRAACRRLGWEFLEGQKSFKWFGTWVGDSEAPRHLFNGEGEYAEFLAMGPGERQDFMARRMGWCDHAVRVPGAEYEIGLQGRNGGYRPVWDYYGPGGLGEVMGPGGGRLLQAYAVEKVRRDAWLQGYVVEELALPNGSVELNLTWGAWQP